VGFFGLEVGLRGLLAHQKAIDVTGNNISNASTEGYSRQRVDLTEAEPWPSPAFNQPIGAGQMGTGATVDQIARLRDSFADAMLRSNVNGQGFWDSKEEVLSKLESITSDTSGSGLTNQLNSFFYAWQEVSKDPGSVNRAVLLENAKGLVSFFHDSSSGLTQLNQDTNQVILSKVTEVNDISAQIADLNRRIAAVEQGHVLPTPTGSVVVREMNANDLRDKRDLLLDRLAKYGTISVSEDNVTGIVSVNMGPAVGGIKLVDGLVPNSVTTSSDAQGNVSLSADLGRGTISGYLAGRDQSLKNVRDNLDKLVNELIVQVNTLHSQGVDAAGGTGNNFFTGSSAADIGLNPVVSADANKIAAAQMPVGYPGVLPASGDGSNAFAIYSLLNKLPPGGIVDPSNPNSDQTLHAFWQGTILNLGIQGKEAIDNSKNQELMVQQMENRRQEVSGVSLDEEMTNMVKYQHGYNAAARVITVMDELLDTVVNRLGTVGR